MSLSFKEKIERCRLSILNNRSLEYFGILSLETNIIIVDAKNNMSGSSYGYTDGSNIYIIKNDDLLVKDINATYIHELIHIISYHCKRRNDKQSYLWNLAIDHVTNAIIWNLINTDYKIPIIWQPDFFLDKDLLKLMPNASAELIYDELLKKRKNETVKLLRFCMSTMKLISEEDVTPDTNIMINDDEICYLEIEQNDVKIKVLLDNNTKSEKEFNEKYSKIIDNAKLTYNIVNSGKFLSKGNLPEYLTIYLENIFKIEIAWDSILKEGILFETQNSSNDKNWSSLDDTLYCHGIFLQGEKKADIRPKLLLIGLDLSGSIFSDKKSLNKFFSVICSSGSYYEEILLITHDIIVHDEKYIEGELDPNNICENFKKLTGGGGTSHKPLFNRIQQLVNDEYYDISSIIFLTDYASDVEQTYNEFEFLKQFKTTWVLNSPADIKLEGCEFIKILIN